MSVTSTSGTARAGRESDLARAPGSAHQSAPRTLGRPGATRHPAPEEAIRRRLATRNRRRQRSSAELSQLFEEREDLRGVSGIADFFVESVRWSA